MRCPYCVTEIADAALVCPQCSRDLYLFKPLLEKIAQLEQSLAGRSADAVAALEARIGTLEQELGELRRGGSITLVEAQDVPAPEPVATGSWLAAAAAAALPALALLVAAHGVLLFVYDVKPIWMRLASIAIPLPFAFWLAARQPGRTGASGAAGFGLAVAAVFAMLCVTAAIDKVPVLPRELRELREVLEYTGSIGLAWFTGLLLGELRRLQQRASAQPSRVIRVVVRAFTPNEKGELGIEVLTKKVQRIVNAASPVAAGAASVYAGIKGVIGD